MEPGDRWRVPAKLNDENLRRRRREVRDDSECSMTKGAKGVRGHKQSRMPTRTAGETIIIPPHAVVLRTGSKHGSWHEAVFDPFNQP